MYYLLISFNSVANPLDFIRQDFGILNVDSKELFFDFIVGRIWVCDPFTRDLCFQRTAHNGWLISFGKKRFFKHLRITGLQNKSLRRSLIFANSVVSATGSGASSRT